MDVRSFILQRTAELRQDYANRLLLFVMNQAGKYVLNQTTVSVQLEQSDRLYGYIGEWMLNKSTRKPTHIDGMGMMDVSGMELDSLYTEDIPEGGDRPAIALDDTKINGTPAEGVYLIWHEGVPIIVQFVSVFEKNAHNIMVGIRRSLRLWSYRGQLNTILSFLNAVNVVSTSNAERTVSVSVSTSQGYWERLHSVPRRPIESVVLPHGQKEALVHDLRHFFDDEDWYVRNAVPFRRGYLLHGLPGTGKSSLLLALAGVFNLPLYILNLADPDLDDSRLQELFSNVGNDVAILLEDVDTLWIDRERQGKLSFSAVLNAIDGVTASQDRVLFMTTNKIENLDPALIRPGRVDYRLEFGRLTNDQAETMIVRFYPELTETIHDYAYHPKIEQMVASELQKLLIDNRESPEGLLAALDTYVPVRQE